MMMATEDLTQMKWCHIRAVENYQGVELENINLRRIITSLRAKNAQIEKIATDSSKEMKDDVSTLKNIYSQEMLLVNQAHATLTKAITNLVTITSDQHRRMVSVCNENKALGESLQILKKSQKETSAQILKDIEKSKSKMSKLKEQLAASEVMRTALSKDNDVIREEYSLETSKTEALNAECLKLKQKFIKTESDSQDAIAAARKNEINCRLECDEVVKETEAEISKLLLFIYELQKENERLVAANVPPENVNHFAKFVQLKSENVALKSQLSTVANRRGSTGAPPVAGKVTSNSNNNNNNNNNNNSSSSNNNLDKSSNAAAQRNENFKKVDMSLLIEKRKNEKKFDRNSERSYDTEIYTRPLAEKIMERNNEKKNNERNEKSAVNVDYLMNGSSPIKLSKRNDRENEGSQKDNLMKGFPCDFMDSVDDFEGENDLKLEKYEQKVIPKTMHRTAVSSGSERSFLSLNNMGNSTLNKVGDINLSTLTSSYIMRTASAPTDIILKLPSESEKTEQSNGVAIINSDKNGEKNGNEADDIFARSIEAIKRSEGGSFIGVPLVGKQTRNALKERLLI